MNVRRSSLALALGLLWSASVAAQSGSAESTVECLRDNVPPAWAGLVDVRIRQPDGSHELRRIAYATRERGRQAQAEYWVRMLAPDSLAGVVHLFRQNDSGWTRWSYLPALDRVSQVKGQGNSSAALEEIVGVRDLDAMLRWSDGATIQFAAPREQGGRQVRPINATRKVGSGASAGFERMRGLMDVERCVMLEGEWRDSDGRQTRSVTVEPASLRRYGTHWLPQRIDVQQSDGVTALVRLQRVVIAPDFPANTFAAERFHTVNPGALGLE
jgi:hypothetical protein